MSAGACVAAGAVALGGPWTHLGGDPSRSVHAGPAPELDEPRWVLSHDSDGRAIHFLPRAGVVATESAVFAPARIDGAPVLLAAGRDSGEVRWTVGLPGIALESWASPALDLRNGTVLYPADDALHAFDLDTGEPVWSTTLQRQVVNASPVVTADMPGRNRVFITDYDGFSSAGRVYCINVDPHDPDLNPHEPGEILWSVPLGTASGSTPTYHDGVVYVAWAGEFGFGAGEIAALPADVTTAPEPMWVFRNPAYAGFFGGVSVDADRVGRARAVYAASYNFYGGQFSANLVKLDPRSGELRWTVPANRSAAIPVPLPGGRIALAGGLPGYGTVPTLQLFQDLGDEAELLWDSAEATWEDHNNNGVIDPGEYLALGGWTHHPVARPVPGGSVLYVARANDDPGGSGASPPRGLLAVDLRLAPDDPGFLLGEAEGAGQTPAIAGGALYSIGSAGLVAYGLPTPRFDVTGDGRVSIDDLHAWTRGEGERDVNRDGFVDEEDRRRLIRELRRRELISPGRGR